MNVSLRLTLVFALCVPLVVFSDTEQKWRYPSAPSIKTVTMGSPVSLVFKKLGPPLKRIDIPPSEMCMPASQNLRYNGFTIGVYRSENGKEARVWSVSVTGKKVIIYPGIVIGMTRKQLIQLLGNSYSDETREDGQWLFWTTPKPVEMFHVRLSNDRVIEFSMREDWS